MQRETRNQEKYEKEKGRLMKFTEVCWENTNIQLQKAVLEIFVGWSPIACSGD